MRFKSEAVGGLQVFAVAGTNVVSFGISAPGVSSTIPASAATIDKVTSTTDNDNDLIRRAKAAWYQTGGTTEPTGAIIDRSGRRYILLTHALGTLAVYRVRNDGALRRMRRWPTEVAQR